MEFRWSLDVSSDFSSNSQPKKHLAAVLFAAVSELPSQGGTAERQHRVGQRQDLRQIQGLVKAISYPKGVQLCWILFLDHSP